MEKRKRKSDDSVNRMMKKVVEEDMNNEDDAEEKDMNDNEYKPRLNQRENTVKNKAKKKEKEEAEAKIGENSDRFKMTSDAVAHTINTIRPADETTGCHMKLATPKLELVTPTLELVTVTYPYASRGTV